MKNGTASMPTKTRDLAISIVDFMPLFNDRIASLFTPAKEVVLGLTKSQGRTLMLLHRNPGRTATELGEALGRTKASLTGVLDALAARGLVRRTADTEDRRKSRLVLTLSGKKACDTLAGEFDKALETSIATLSASDREALARHLRAVTEILAKI
jgi:DNA-binding MarR family transcriptional regulator